MKKFLFIFSTVLLLSNCEVYSQSLFSSMLSRGVNPRLKTFDDIKQFILLNDYSISNVNGNDVEFSFREYREGDNYVPSEITVEKEGQKITCITEHTFFFGQEHIKDFIEKFKTINSLFPQVKNLPPYMFRNNFHIFNYMKVAIKIDTEEADEGGFCTATIIHMEMEKK